jgi:hypothetical protein
MDVGPKQVNITRWNEPCQTRGNDAQRESELMALARDNRPVDSLPCTADCQAQRPVKSGRDPR